MQISLRKTEYLLYKTIINYIFVKIIYCFKASRMNRRYTKADLEQIVYSQLENLNAIHDLLSIMKHQNELLNSANKKLKDEISDFKQKLYPIRRNSKA